MLLALFGTMIWFGGEMMEIKPIRSEAEYEAALEEIESLFDVPANTPAEDRLKLLTILVEVYEAKHYPIPPPARSCS